MSNSDYITLQRAAQWNILLQYYILSLELHDNKLKVHNVFNTITEFNHFQDYSMTFPRFPWPWESWHFHPDKALAQTCPMSAPLSRPNMATIWVDSDCDQTLSLFLFRLWQLQSHSGSAAELSLDTVPQAQLEDVPAISSFLPRAQTGQPEPGGELKFTQLASHGQHVFQRPESKGDINGPITQQ